MNLTQNLSELVRACFTGIWLQSHEHEDALLRQGRIHDFFVIVVGLASSRK